MKTQFDKIYVLSLITNKERQKFITYQMNELGLDFEFIYGIDFYNFQNLTWPDVYKYTSDAEMCKGTSRNFGCALTHYSAVMQAYHLGYNNVLIFEDDVCLNTNKNLWETMLNNIPNNIGFIEYDLRCWDDETKNKIINKIKFTNDKYVPIDTKIRKCGAAMYAIMNRNIMELYLDSQHECFVQSDWVKNFWYETTIERYISAKCLFIDQFTYQNKLIENNIVVSVYDNLYFKINKYNESDFFKPNSFHIMSRY